MLKSYVETLEKRLLNGNFAPMVTAEDTYIAGMSCNGVLPLQLSSLLARDVGLILSGSGTMLLC